MVYYPVHGYGLVFYNQYDAEVKGFTGPLEDLKRWIEAANKARPSKDRIYLDNHCFSNSDIFFTYEDIAYYTNTEHDEQSENTYVFDDINGNRIECSSMLVIDIDVSLNFFEAAFPDKQALIREVKEKFNEINLCDIPEDFDWTTVIGQYLGVVTSS